MFILKNIVRGKNKMAKKEQSKKQEVMTCKCEVSEESTNLLKNCKCKPTGRKERTYDSVIIEKD